MPGVATRIVDFWLTRGRPQNASSVQARSAVAQLKPTVLVTGGSRGIGYAIAECFAHNGRDVTIAARSELALSNAAQSIEAKTGRRVVTIRCDLTSNTAIAEIDEGLRQAGFYLDILVNNAGLGLAGPFIGHDERDISRLIDLNVVVLTRLCRHALPAMLLRRRGGILNVASLGAFVPGPHQAAYYASKAYVASLTEALASECAGQGVRIAVLAPGPVDTGFHATMDAEGSRYRQLLPAMHSDAAARAAYRGFVFGQRVIVPGILARLSFVALKILPHPVSVPLVSWLLKKPEL